MSTSDNYHASHLALVQPLLLYYLTVLSLPTVVLFAAAGTANNPDYLVVKSKSILPI